MRRRTRAGAGPRAGGRRPLAVKGDPVMIGTERIERRFAALRADAKGGLIAFVTAGDPDPETSWEILKGLPGAGADAIEIGMPFTDPMADGPAVQESSLRALKAGMTLDKTLALVERFRAEVDETTPIVLMGYFNPIHKYGTDRFLNRAAAAGVDGLIVVDLPAEEDGELCVPASQRGIAFIRLVTPTTDAVRLPTVLKNTAGFLYYVAITGITGTKAGDQAEVSAAVDRLKAASSLPVAVGFGIVDADAVRRTLKSADAAVVGSAIVNRIKASLDENGRATDRTVPETLAFVESLAAATRA